MAFVGLQSVIVAFLGNALSFIESIVTVEGNTIRLNYKSALAETN